LNTPQQPLAVTADKAYDSQRARQQIKDEGALPIIPSRSNATRKAYCPKRFYRQRHKIENFFCRIKRLAAHRQTLVGRIMLHPQAPKDQPWFWMITAREIPPSVHNRGYSQSREQAMADFKKQWFSDLAASGPTEGSNNRPAAPIPSPRASGS
jgi:hypothetical protein